MTPEHARPADSPPQVLVTRPAREAARWVSALQSRGLRAAALPLIAIGPAPDAAALERCRAQLPGYAAVMFVSANAAEGLLPQPGAWPDARPAGRPRAWCTGPGTGGALRRAGVPPHRIDQPDDASGRFDSEALWALVDGQVSAGDRVLIVRGADAQGAPSGRDWLAERLRALGVQVELVAAYTRARPAWDASEQALALGGGRPWWLFSSSEAVANLLALCPALDRAGSRAVCTHERIAQAARRAGFATVAEVAPTLHDVAAFLQSHP